MKPHEHVEQRVARLTQRCLEAHLPLTAQRRAIMAVLAGRGDHPTVDQVFSEVTRTLPEVSRTTVYRALETLTKLGLIVRAEHPGSAVRFDANMDPHHHFLCTSCGGLSDLPLDAVVGHERLAYAGMGPERAAELAVLVRGTCRDCLGS